MGSTALTPDLISDQTPLPVGTPEELAGPPETATAPVREAERISSVDVLRGVSLMGILIMNICDFAYGFADYAYPLSTVKPVFIGPHAHVNTTLWFLRWILAEGKMRALFSLLFGAGVILMTGRAEARGAGVRTADIYTRRNMWLMLFGMLHCYFIWNGDILYFYATTALIFLFPMRHLKPKTLIWVGSCVLLLNTLVVQVGQTTGIYFQHKSYVKAQAKLDHHQPMTEDDWKSLDSWHKAENQWRPSTKDMYKNIADHKSWPKGFAADVKNAFQGETIGAYAGFGDWLGMMLLGMALFKNGFLTGKLKTSSYILFAVIGLGIAWPLTFIGAWHAWKGGFDYVQTYLWMQAPYDIGRVGGALGNAAVILLLLRAGVFKWVFTRIAKVGQMALSNYLLTSTSMQAIFVWCKPHWYGYLDYYKVYYVVACVWLVNLVFSSIWLHYFQFGPIEWCWRSLTYWKRQPMRRSLASSSLIPAVSS
jgi:uncharacterized protein